ncbi:MAG: bifunctional metallophosphatase/5'-nucleotidase [Planctomycetia bacterium]|nr:bifunctional metallophosphatase/5'-nucleotidase [Planctomycetia bacterium]
MARQRGSTCPSRREVLARAAGACATAAGACAAAVAGGPVAAARDLGRARTVSIFHTTDLHGRILPTSTYDGLDDVGGLARCATCIRRWRRESPHSLTVDVGDVVQGTAVSLATGGGIMIDLFNRLGYDAWTLGNHDFDWGPEKLEANLAASRMPVLTGNVERAGARAGSFAGAWAGVRPWIVREVGGFRIGLIGLITPGLPFWLPPALLAGVAATDPAAALATSLREIAAEKPDAVVVAGHMGWRFHDDYANPVREMLRGAKGVDVYLAGHSHQDRPAWSQHGVLCSQASYYGIHCGRVDLTFDLDSRRLVDRRAFTLLMDDRFDLDPAVMERARPDLARAEEQAARRVATARRPLGGTGRDSAVARLLCATFAAALGRHGRPVDGVFHGTFASGDIPAGEVTVGDCWRIIPYENVLVTAELAGRDLLAVVAEDAGDAKSDRTLWPFEVVRDEAGRPRSVRRDGREVDPDRRFTIAFNSYDAQSAGRRLLKLREILDQPAARLTTTPLDTRTALVEGLLDQGEIG